MCVIFCVIIFFLFSYILLIITAGRNRDCSVLLRILFKLHDILDLGVLVQMRSKRCLPILNIWPKLPVSIRNTKTQNRMQFQSALNWHDSDHWSSLIVNIQMIPSNNPYLSIYSFLRMGTFYLQFLSNCLLVVFGWDFVP